MPAASLRSPMPNAARTTTRMRMYGCTVYGPRYFRSNQMIKCGSPRTRIDSLITHFGVFRGESIKNVLKIRKNMTITSSGHTSSRGICMSNVGCWGTVGVSTAILLVTAMTLLLSCCVTAAVSKAQHKEVYGTREASRQIRYRSCADARSSYCL